MAEPRRWLEEDCAPELARALRTARGELGSQQRVAQLWARLAPLAGSSAPSSVASPGPGASALPGAKGWTVLNALVVLGAALGYYALAGRPTPARRPARVPLAAAPTHAGPQPGSAPAAARAPVPAPRLQRAHQGIAASKRAARAPAATHQPAPAAAVDPDAELALLTRAERALATRPAVALVILQEHEQRFAQGVLAQERETMRIDAELALGQRAQAVARARAFIARFPGSPHRHRFEPLLASPPPPPSDHKHRAPHIPTD